MTHKDFKDKLSKSMISQLFISSTHISEIYFFKLSEMKIEIVYLHYYLCYF